MFKAFLNKNTLSEYTFGRLLPPAEDRAFWEKKTNAAHVKDAEKYLGYNWPLIRATQYMAFQTEANRLAQETPHLDRRQALLLLLLGELAENKGRFLPDITDGIFAICEETFWGFSAHKDLHRKKELLPPAENSYIDLFAAETGELLAITYHLLYQPLKAFCPPILERIEYELDRRIVQPYLEHGGYRWMGAFGQTVSNWLPWILSNILTVFLVTDLRRSKLEYGIQKMMTEIQRYYDSLPADGGCDEGSGYWTKAGAKLFEFCDQLYLATDGKINFFHDAKLREIMLYETRVYIDKLYFVNFADGTGRFYNALLDYPLYGYGLRAGEEACCRLAKALKACRTVQFSPHVYPRGISAKNLIFSLVYAEEIDGCGEFQPQPFSLLPDTQAAFLRKGGWYLAAKGGHNHEVHNHNDVGSFIVYEDGCPVLIDPGCGTYTRQTFGAERYTIWTMCSDWHNLPLVNGQTQPNGRLYAANSFDADQNGVQISFQDAYPAEAGLLRLTRRLTVSREAVRTEDAYTFRTDSNTVTACFITLLEPKVTEQGVELGGKYLLETPLPCTVEYKSFEGDKKLIDNWMTEGVYRLQFTAECQKEATLTFTVRRKQK